MLTITLINCKEACGSLDTVSSLGLFSSELRDKTSTTDQIYLAITIQIYSSPFFVLFYWSSVGSNAKHSKMSYFSFTFFMEVHLVGFRKTE